MQYILTQCIMLSQNVDRMRTSAHVGHSIRIARLRLAASTYAMGESAELGLAGHADYCKPMAFGVGTGLGETLALLNMSETTKLLAQMYAHRKSQVGFLKP